MQAPPSPRPTCAREPRREHAGTALQACSPTGIDTGLQLQEAAVRQQIYADQMAEHGNALHA